MRDLRLRVGRQPVWAAAAGLLVFIGFDQTPAAAQQEVQLPGLIVEGATLSRPAVPRAPRPAAPSGRPTAAAAETPAAAEDSGEEAVGVPASEIGSAVTIVTGQELRDRQIRNGAEALRALPGVHVTRNSTPGSVTEVRIRGAENNQTLVLIDGVVANDPTNGAYDFSDLSTVDIERIEVIRGAQSVIYGPGAIGGVVNIITRGGRGPARVTISSEVGSFGTRDLTIGASGGSERIWGSLGYNARKSNGFNIAPRGREDDASSLETFYFRGGVQVFPGLVVDGSLRFSRKSGERDGFIGPPNGLSVAVDDPSYYSGSVLLGSIRARWETFDGALVHEFRTTYNDTRTTDQDLPAPPLFPFFSKYNADSRTHSYLATLKLPGSPLFRHAVTGLVEWNEEGFASLGDFVDDRGRHSRERLAFAGEWRASFANQLYVTAGVRRDDNSTFADFTSWRTTASWNLPGSILRPHASAGTGFKAPSFFEQYGRLPGSVFFIPNPDLIPEESFGWDAGIEFSLWRGKLLFDVTYFQAETENKIATNTATPSPSVINLPGLSHRKGVEISAKYQVLPGTTVGAAYTYLDATDPRGDRELRRPPHSGRLDVNARFNDGRGNLHLAAVYNGRQDDRSFRNGPGPFDPQTIEILSLDATWRLSAALSYELRPGWEIFGRLENILDDRGQEVFGYAQPGFAAYAGMRLTLGGESGGLKP